MATTPTKKCPNPGCIHSVILDNEFFCILPEPRRTEDGKVWYCEDEERPEDFRPENLYAKYLPKGP